MNYMNWMYLTTSIHDQQLRYICLPASHDSGTYSLTDSLTQGLDSDEKQLIYLLTNVANAISGITNIQQFIPDAESWIYSVVIPSIQGIMTATSSSVAQQLADGIRCLDLRVYCDPGSSQYYTYHTLIGSPMEEVLSDISEFLSSTIGEILYVTMGHYRPSVGIAADFRNMVEQFISGYAYVPEFSNGVLTNNPFNQTYSQIISQNSTGSKVILIDSSMDDFSQGSIFWPSSFSPPDSNDMSDYFYGRYSNTSSLSCMLGWQNSEFTAAGRLNLPYALYMTLTPQDSDVSAIVGNVLSNAIFDEATTIAPTNPTVAQELRDVVSMLLPYMKVMEWTSLQELCKQVDTQVGTLINENFLSGWAGPNPLSLIYLDYYETTDIVDLAINYSQGVFDKRPT